MLANVSNYLANYISQRTSENHDVTVLAYGLQIVLGELIKLVLIIFLAIITNTLATTGLCLIIYIAIRKYGGGVHLSTYLRCLIFGVFLLVGLGNLATVEIASQLLMGAATLVSILGVVSIVKWVPAGTKKKTITKPTERLKQKNKTTFILAIWLLAVSLLIKLKLNTFALSLILGAAASFILLTPWGYKAMETLEALLDFRRKEVEKNV